MNNLLSWMKSTRSIVVVLLIVGLVLGLFTGHASPDLYKEVVMVVVVAYFGKREDSK